MLDSSGSHKASYTKIKYGGIDLADLILAHEGVVIVWKLMLPPANAGWVADLIVTIATGLMSFIRVTGQLLSASFAVAYAAVSHLQEFHDDNPLELEPQALTAIIDSVRKSRKYWATDFLDSSAGHGLRDVVAR
jgi:hypothetical protein